MNEGKLKPANIIVNGQSREIRTGFETISYHRLCLEANVDNALNPSVTYLLPDDQTGIVAPGELAPLVDGAVYDVQVTGAA